MNRGQEMWWRKVFYLQEVDRLSRKQNYSGIDEFVRKVETSPTGLDNTFKGAYHTTDSAIAQLKHLQNNVTPLVKETIENHPKNISKQIKHIDRGLKKAARDRDKENAAAIAAGRPIKEVFEPEDTRVILERELAQQMNKHIDSTILRLQGSRVVTGRRHNPDTDTFDYSKEIHSNKNVDAAKESLRELGYEAIDDQATNVEQALSNLPDVIARRLGGIVENDSTIITRSVDNALSNTFAAHATKGGLLDTLLGFYQKAPFLAEMGIMFPRFLANQWMWLWERNPMNLLYAFDSNQWKGLSKGKGVNPQLARKLSTGMQGLMLNQAAWFIRNSGLAGPKYYQINTGAEDEEGNPVYIDARPYNPFAQYLGFQQVARQMFSEHELPNKMTANEFVDLGLGVRRFSEAPVFAIPYIAQAFERGGMEGMSEMFAKLGGDAMRGFLVPFKSVNEIMGGLGEAVYDWEGDDSTIGNIGLKVSQETLDIKDAMEDEFFGNIVSDIPGLRSVVPTRVDPFTGEYMRTKGPLKRQFLGRTTREQTRWETTLGEVNLKSFDMVGKWRSRSAQQIMSQEIGTMLNARQANGRTLGDNMADQVREKTRNLPIELRRQYINRLNTGLRNAATAKAAAKYHKLFRKELALKKVDPVFRDNISELLK
jgi:hypothetical protein